MRSSLSILAVVVLQLVLVSNTSAQNPFTFTSVEQELPSTMFGSAEWVDIDGDNDYDFLQFGNASNLSAPTLLSFRSVTERIWFRQTDSGTIIQAADYGTEQLASPNIWFSNSGWLDADSDGDHDLLVVGSANSTEPYSISTFVLSNNSGAFTATELGIQSAISGSISTGDIDNDGDHDVFMSGLSESGIPTSRVYRNDGGMSFVEVVTEIQGFALGDSDLGDYDEDGDLDLLISGVSADGSFKTSIYDNDGGGSFSLATDAIEGLVYGSVEWGDYDQDGDLDFLVNGGRFSPTLLVGVFQVYTNNGGSFSKVLEEGIGAVHGSAIWADFDHDGDLDILVAGGREILRSRSHGRLYLNDDSQQYSHVANIPVPFPATVSIGDYDGDSDLDLLTNGLSDRNQPIVFQYENRVRILNNAPSVPTVGAVQIEGGLATLSWQESVDTETQSSGLTYAIRIGTQPGQSDVMIAAATGSNGYRRFASRGNVSQNTSWTVDLPNGTYYWSVQAVDNSYSGSPFSEEMAFTISESGKGVATTTDSPESTRKYALHAPYPNPVSDYTSITVDIPSRVFVSVEVFDAIGRKIRTLARRSAEIGQSVIEWKTDDDSGARVGSGIYFVRLSSELGVETRTVVVR